jgi:hypothetical protein
VKDQETKPSQTEPAEAPDGTKIPESASVFDGIDCDAPLMSVLVTVELPFWLMVPNGEVSLTVGGAPFALQIDESYVDLFVAEASDSRRTVVYNGPVPPKNALLAEAALSGAALMFRKAKTVLKIQAKCSSDAFAAITEKVPRSRAAYYYFVAFCSAHLPVVNRLIDVYRWATADSMAATVTPRTVPIWRIRNDKGEGFHVCLLQEATWDYKPQMMPFSARNTSGLEATPFVFVDLQTLGASTSEVIEPCELALLDARSFLHRGDYSGAVRRMVTALEVLLERQLRGELAKSYASAEVDARLLASRNDFPGRLRQYQKLSTRTLSDVMQKNLDEIREMRHEIVHRGRVLSYGERHVASKAVDFGRFIYNWLENDPASVQRREKLFGQQALGGIDIGFFQAEITSEGVRVKRPTY